MNPELIRWIACPLCRGELDESAERLRCRRCGEEYEIRRGIPLLYPRTMDTTHLKEEENLAEMMRSRGSSPKEQFNLSQWALSKQEFWQMVRDNIQAPPKTFINIGCGYDSSFRPFEDQGYTFINFDMVYDILDTLRGKFGARFCAGGDVNSLPFKNGVFDYVVSIDVVHHESGRLAALIESFGELLRPGGTLFLEDPNAWGMFQMAKSALLPKPVYRRARAAYHRLKRSRHRPADYEFATSVWTTAAILRKLGFRDITVHANHAYPAVGKTAFRCYEALGRFDFVRRYHNFHYMISAVRS